MEDSNSGEEGERSRTRRADSCFGDALGEFAARSSEVEVCEGLLEPVGVPNERLLRGVRCEDSRIE